jgi:hypothetical protein
MKRKEKNDLVKRMADQLDSCLTNLDLPAEQAAEIINLLKECDVGMYLKHEDRKYHTAIKNGKIVLERVTG